MEVKRQLKMTFNEALRKFREAIGQSQQVFATNLGISISGLRNYEKDREPHPFFVFRLHQMLVQNQSNVVRGKPISGAVYDAINDQFLRARTTIAPALTSVLTFGAGEESDRGGVLFEFLTTADEYKFAVAFQKALEMYRGGGKPGRDAATALQQLHDRIWPHLSTGELTDIDWTLSKAGERP